jgi:hypothetical protein
MPKRIVDVDVTKDAPKGTIEEQTIHWAETMRERAKKSREEVLTRMDTNSDFYEAGGKQWGGKKMPSYRATIEDNRCFANVESALPIITDNRPKAEIIAANSEDIITVNELKDAFDAKWEDLDLDLMVVMAVKDALVLTEGYWKVWFDPSLMGGIGDVAVSQVSARNIFPDPDSKHPLLKDAYYVCYSAPSTYSNLILQYPKKATQLKKEFSGKTPDSMKQVNNNDMIVTSESAHDSGDTPETSHWSQTKGLGAFDKLPFNELWVDDKTAEEVTPDYIVYLDKVEAVEKTDESFQKAITSGREFEIFAAKDLTKIGLEDGTQYVRKYPNGRIIAWVGNTLLRDEESPYEHGRCPYVRFFRYTVPDKNYFFGEIDQIIPLQEELNKRKSQAIDLLNLCVNPPMIVYQGSGIDTNKVTNRPGLMLTSNVPVDQAAKWLQMPNIPSAMFVQMSTINQDIDTVSGIHDATQGRKPTGVTAGIAIEAIQEAAQTRLRLAARFLEWSLKHASELILSIIWQYYKEPRTIRKRGAEGWTYKDVNFGNRELQGGLPNVKIQAGSTLPMNKSVLKQQALQLFQLQAIDQRALLEIFDFPNIEATISRMGSQPQMPQGEPQKAGM